MINNIENPVEWSSLIYELDDAKEHLENLVRGMASGKIDEVDYKIQLSHIYAHLNRSWNTRNKVGENSDKENSVFSRFPKDIVPFG